jgi:hypothetical protein
MAMIIHVNKPLFDWEAIEDSPSLGTLRELLEALPDAKLLERLRQLRGRGRDDYPVHILWGVALLRIALRHPTTQSCLDELHRNRDLRRLIGIEHEGDIPKKWNMSRFMDVLGSPACQPELVRVFDVLIRRLTQTVPSLGEECAGDSAHFSARLPQSAQGQQSPMPQPTGGHKEYTDDEGKVVEVLEWFGYKVHLLADKRHEVVLAYTITSASVTDNEALKDLYAKAKENLPPDRMKTLAYDKAADDGEVHAMLDQDGVAPVIRIRSMWKEEPERMLPGHDGTSNIVYDELGTLYCYDKTSDPPIRRPMYFQGHEADRGTLKYRCPIRAQGGTCAHDAVCNKGLAYGKTVRVKQEIDLRRFPPIPRSSLKFQRLYKGRTSVERVIARMKIFWGADDGNITGAERFHAETGVLMIVHAAFATLLASAPRWEGTFGHTRLSTIAQALRGYRQKKAG